MARKGLLLESKDTGLSTADSPVDSREGKREARIEEADNGYIISMDIFGGYGPEEKGYHKKIVQEKWKKAVLALTMFFNADIKKETE